MASPIRKNSLKMSRKDADFVSGVPPSQSYGAWYFPAYDANGNITQYVDEDGHVVASYAYDAFGNTVAESGAMASAFSPARPCCVPA